MRSFLRAATRIFRITAWVKTLPVPFPGSPYGPRVCVLLWWAGALLRVPSAEALERWGRAGRLRRLARPHPSADTLRRHLDAVPPDVWHAYLRGLAQRLVTNRVWDQSRVAGYRVVAVDGVEWFATRAQSCGDCTRRVVQGVTAYAHKSVVASRVGAIPMALDWETQRPADGTAKSEAEWRAVQRLFSRLGRAFHHHIDVVVADAEYCTRVFLQAVRGYGWDAVVRLKNERLTIGQEAQGLLKVTPPVLHRATKQETLVIWDLPDITWGALTGLRVVVWQRWDHRAGRPREDDPFHAGYAVTTAGPGMTAEAVYTIMRHRWEEENCIFRRGQSGWALGHCFGHTPALIEALIGLQLGAMTLWAWWGYRQRVARPGPVPPECARIEAARGELARMRTDWTARFGTAS